MSLDGTQAKQTMMIMIIMMGGSVAEGKRPVTTLTYN